MEFRSMHRPFIQGSMSHRYHIASLVITVMAAFSLPMQAQRTLSLDDCRQMALQNNKQLNATRMQQQVAGNLRKAAHTKYLPHVNAVGGYQFFSREISILNNSQKSFLSNMGTNAISGISGGATSVLTQLVQSGIFTEAQAQAIAQQFQSSLTQMGQPIADQGNKVGQQIRDAFRTDSKNIWSGAVVVTQPIYMGGGIKALNEMTRIGEQMAYDASEYSHQNTLFNIDNTYWTVVSVKHKLKLAQSYLELVKKLNADVHKMISTGVATRANGLKVDVAQNTAEMQVTQAEDGVTLAKMLLCQLCGIPINENITLVDEDAENLATKGGAEVAESDSVDRPELRMLRSAVEMSEQTTKLVQAEYLPHIALTGGYMISNPNVLNGFEKKFGGVWNIGVALQVPVWNWFEGKYKIRASKAATAIADLTLSDMSEKVDLQVQQNRFRLKEAKKKLQMAEKNLESAEENLRCANVGFKEGVMTATEVMEAQTAWQQAQSQKIDAEVDVVQSRVALRKSLGILQ